MPTNKYDGPLNSAAVFALAAPAALTSFWCCSQLWLLWLTPAEHHHPVIYFFAGRYRRVYRAAALAPEASPEASGSGALQRGVGLTPMTAPIKLVAADHPAGSDVPIS